MTQATAGLGRAIPSQICQLPVVPETAQPIPGRRLLFALLVILLIAVIPSIVVPTLMCRPEQKPLPDLGEVTAFELVDQTGAPFTASLPSPTPYYPSVQLGVDLDTAALDERIALRVDRMWADGLVDEVRALVGEGLPEGRTASRALGYQQVLRFLAGELTEVEAYEETIRATRRFVRRQRSWFRRDPRVHWLDSASPAFLDTALRVVAEHRP